MLTNKQTYNILSKSTHLLHYKMRTTRKKCLHGLALENEMVPLTCMAAKHQQRSQNRTIGPKFGRALFWQLKILESELKSCDLECTNKKQTNKNKPTDHHTSKSQHTLKHYFLGRGKHYSTCKISSAMSIYSICGSHKTQRKCI